ncbi:DUF87 domain-containing protein [Halorussus salilacus]|uniref:helicase HerA domain-containing protein n=1 Tax=Halorussus salilacus TaxID=2953750 RepID=UPI00209CDD62|nr:DUF87 domain-containing protein [Halorussus salilacus]USZ68538.1 DUF87 domain-containing protein [Halorussus salilacus]
MSESGERPRPHEVEQLQALMERVGESEDRMAKLLTIASMDAETYADLRELYEQQAARAVTKDVFYPYEVVDGPVGIGTDPDGRRIGLTRDQVNEHLLLVGMTGAGKTTFFYNLMATAVGHDVPFLVFDFKNDYRHLVQHQDLLVVNWRDFKFNPLQPPPDVQPGKWGEILADTFAHATDLLIGSESYFLDQLRRIYELYDTAATDQYPSLFELRDLVAADEIRPASPRFKYKERVHSRLSMMTGFSGAIFDCSQGYPIDALLDRNVVLELKEPNQYVTNFVVEALLTWIFYYRDAMGQRQKLRHLIMFDEAKRVFDVNRSRQPASGYPPIDDLVGKIREFGEGLVVADHEPSKLSDSLKANTTAKLWLTLGSGTDIQEMAQTFGLDPEETEFTRTMQKGEGLFKLADREPVPIRLPDYELDKAMTEAEIRARMAPELEALPVQDRVRPDRFNEYLGITSEAETADETTPVGEIAEALLASVTEMPFLSISKRYEAIGVGSKNGTAAKSELVTLGLVREVTVPTGRPGRNPTLLELTPVGRDVLDERGYDVPETGRRGIVHRYWQHQVKEYYAAHGFAAELEFAVGSQRIDVYAERADETIAIEVACSPEHEVTNIEKCLDAGVDTVQVVTIEDAVRDRIQSAVQERFGHVPDRVVFKPISAFV